MKVELIAIGRVIPYAGNPRKNAAAVANVAASLKEFGWRQPIVVDPEMVVVEGHTRLAAAKLLEMAKVPVHVAHDLTPAQLRAYRLADNRTGEDAAWDPALLGVELTALELDGYDLARTGFDRLEIAELRQRTGPSAKEVDEQPIGAVPAQPITKPGDLIALGRHRLLCGDSTYPEQVDRLLGTARADLVFTDPPYGVNVTGKGGDAIDGDISFTAIPLMFAVLDRCLSDGAWVYICGGQSNMPLYSRLFEHHFRQLPRVAIWDKGKTAVMRHNGYHSCYEMIYYTFRTGGGARWFSERTSDHADDIWRIPLDPTNERQHPTQKPVQLPARAIRNTCPPEGVVFDPFAGVGSTLLAAELLGRTCYAVEMAPGFCDVIVSRWEKATGETAVRPVCTAAKRLRVKPKST